jgi:hypothetical protein
MAFNYSPKIVTDGLVLYLDAANSRSYPGSGTTWTDISRSGTNGTLVNGPTFNSANGGSVVFDGVNDYVITPSITNFRSICMWVNKPFVEFGAAPWKYLLDARPGFASGFFANNSPGGWSNWFLNGTSISSTWSLLPVDQWFHLYIQANANYTSTINFMSRVSNNENLGGRISNIQIYNRALSASEIQQNYNATKGRYL